jgi:hypothetical protein
MYGQFDVPFQLRAAGGDWSESTVSLENAPGAGEVVASFPVLDRGTFIQPPGPGNNGAWAEVDVTSAIEAARRGSGAAGFYVVNTTSERRWVHAREDLDFPPVLIVYSDDPTEPGTSRDIRVTLNVGGQAAPQARRP